MAENDGGPVLSDEERLRLSADIVAAFVSHNRATTDEVAALIGAAYEALSGIDGGSAPTEAVGRAKPAVPVSRSIHPDHLVCLEDGKHLKMLKRYLRTQYGLSPEEYRRRWGLPHDYPMVAPNYALRRSDFAKKIGLGKGVRRK